MATNPKVDEYIERSDTWPDEMQHLRHVLLGTGLTEELKWRQPCYTHDGRNIAIMQELKAFLGLMFFKGELLSDRDGVLVPVGQNSRSASRVHLTSVDDVDRLAPAIEALVAEAVEVEEAGLSVGPAPEPELAEELTEALEADPKLKAAFESLTPGRRREYNLHVAGAKKAETRRSRVEKAVPQILAGKGLRER